MSRIALSRRQMMKGMSYSLGALALRGYQVQAAAGAYFTHGIASGDPLSDRVILWTRVIPGSGKAKSISVAWQVSLDENFNKIVSSGHQETGVTKDFTVKVDATGLKPGQDYYYRFDVDGTLSPTGRTKTLPLGSVQQYKIGVTSCANYPQGFFNAYQDMAQAELDLIMHLGDYIYEYADGTYANNHALTALDRHVKPSHEIISLEDYRMRYGLYRTDPDLQAAHQNHPWICVWDDHELANNVWQHGAQNHNEGEGDFAMRMKFAKQAYHEWLPIRTPGLDEGGDQGVIYRSFKVGDLADLIMLDARLHGRAEQLDYRNDMPPKLAAFDLSKPDKPLLKNPASVDDKNLEWLALAYDLSLEPPALITDYTRLKSLKAESMPEGIVFVPDLAAFKSEKLDDEARSILGLDQETWLRAQLKTSKARGATWQVLGQQVLMGKLIVPKLTADANKPLNRRQSGLKKMLDMLAGNEMPFNMDAWDGYPNCQTRVKQDLKQHAANPVVLAGDTHNAWVFNLLDETDQHIGVEVGTPGVTSPGMESFMPADPGAVEDALKKSSPELLDVDASQRGWVELVLTPEATTSQWRFVDTILQKNFKVTKGPIYRCEVGKRKFEAV